MKLQSLFPGRWNPEYLRPCSANIPLGRVGNPLSEKPDTTGGRERGPFSVTASNTRALHLHPHRADAGTNTAPGREEGAETPSGMRRPRPCRSTLYPLPSPSHSASVGLARAMQAWTGETGKGKKKTFQRGNGMLE